MSAFEVSDKTMHAILSALRNSGMIESFEVDPMNDADMTRLGRELFMMNHRALLARYNEPLPDEVPYQFRFMDCSLVVSYKATRCLLYQCTEGNVPEEELFKSLAKFSAEIAQVFVERTDEYEKTPWDL